MGGLGAGLHLPAVLGVRRVLLRGGKARARAQRVLLDGLSLGVDPLTSLPTTPEYLCWEVGGKSAVERREESGTVLRVDWEDRLRVDR